MEKIKIYLIYFIKYVLMVKIVMGDKMDLSRYNVRTDLVKEILEHNGIVPDESFNTEEEYNNIKITKTIVNEELSGKLNKKPGLYYLIDINNVDIHDHDDNKNIENALTKVLKEVLNNEGITLKSKGLIVGLGNDKVTPDSLGPLVIEDVIVTRHMFMLDEEVSEGISNVSAIAPGVMGNTGIETSDVIDAVAKKIKVDYIIVVDSLAASNVSRVNKSIQITNTGISPGSGIGNRRKELSKEVLGVPVIAIGVPTVVDAVTITSNTIEYILKYFSKKINDGEKPSDKIVISEKMDFDKYDLPSDEARKILLGEFGGLGNDERINLINSILSPNGLNMMVTPKEIDVDIEDLASVISGAIDRSLHRIVEEEI